VGWYRSTCSDRRRPHRCNPAEARSAPAGSPRSHCVAADSRTPWVPGPPRRSAPAPASPRSAPPGPGSSGCQVAARRRRALGSSPAAPVGTDTPSHATPRPAGSASPPTLPPRSARTSLRPPLAHLCWHAPGHTRGAGCPPARPCRRAGRTGNPARSSPCHRAFSAKSGSLQVLSGSSPITPPRLLRKHTRSQGPSLHQSYPASAVLRPCPTSTPTDASQRR
jgi:hypothetical protein